MSSESPDQERLPFDPGRIRGARDEGGGAVCSPGGQDESAGGRAGGLPDGNLGERTVTVSQLTRMVKGAIQKGLPRALHVVGELSNVSRPSGGHIYFTLKDASSEVRCVMWRSSARSVRFELNDGLEVVATGEVDVYEPRGQYQLYVRRMEPRGVGALELAFAQLKERLGKEGLFDADRKRPLPSFPRRIAVVTSPTGAAVRDILQTIRRRFPKVHVFVYGVRVQGEAAAGEIADAIERINRASRRLGCIDLMIVGRGGGSLEDLWAFNEEVVARAIHASEIPVVSAVGHEVDFTIADFVADVRAATPTAAAELVVPVSSELLADLERIHHRQTRAIGQRMDAARSRLAFVQSRPWFRDPLGQVRIRYQQIDEMAGRLRSMISARLRASLRSMQSLELHLLRARPAVQLARAREQLGTVDHRIRRAQAHFRLDCERRLRRVELRTSSASPKPALERHRAMLGEHARRMRQGIGQLIRDRCVLLASIESRFIAGSHGQVLNRGFSITRRMRGGKLVKSPADVREGDRLMTETAGGEIASRVFDAKQGDLFEE